MAKKTLAQLDASIRKPIDEAQAKQKAEELGAIGEADVKQYQAQQAQNYWDQYKGEDPRLKDAQMQALGKLGEYSQGKMTAEDLYRYNQMKAMRGQEEKGQRQAIAQQAAMRGLSGSGLGLAQQIQAQQSGADRASMEGLGLEAQAQNRAMSAVNQMGQLGGQMRDLEFGQFATRAGQTNQLGQFNVGQVNQTGLSNADAINRINMFNREQQTANKQIQQQSYQADLDRQQKQRELIYEKSWGKYGKDLGKVAVGGIFTGIGGYIAGKAANPGGGSTVTTAAGQRN